MMDDGGVREAFEIAMVRVTTCAPMVHAIATTSILDVKFMKRVEQSVATQEEKEVNELVPSLMVVNPPSPHASPENILTSEDK